MSDEPRHKIYGDTLSDYVVMIANELPIDAVGMWQIVPIGRRGFGLEGEALIDFIRRAIRELLSRGAVPVVGGADRGGGWLLQRQYGTTPDEIIDNVVAEWLASGAKDEDPGGLWFALEEDTWDPDDEDSRPIKSIQPELFQNEAMASDFILRLANELPKVPVGMWQIVLSLRDGFGFEGEALIDFIRRAIRELLSRGAVPIIGGVEQRAQWIRQRRYGTTPDEIIDNVIAEWLAGDAKNDDLDGLWFALKELTRDPDEGEKP